MSPTTNITDLSGHGMDRKIAHPKWHWRAWPLAARVGAAAGGGVAVVLIFVAVFFSNSQRSVRLPEKQLTIAAAQQAVYRDFVPLRAKAVPRDTVYLDAVEGGRVDRVLVEPGDMVEVGQPLLEFGNTNLQLQVIQQESQLNQAISQLQQNEIQLEQNRNANERALQDIDYNIIRLERSMARRDSLAQRGAASQEQRDQVADELEYFRRLRPIQAETNKRQGELNARLLPSIRAQLKNLNQNLNVVRSKLDNLIVRAPVAGRVTDIDLKVGENRNAGQRLAQVTPETGYKLSADVDEFYLSRIRNGQTADVDIAGANWKLTVTRVYPQVKDGRFTVDLAFQGDEPPNLLPGQSAQGKLAMGGDTNALVLPAGAFLERTGGDWLFVLDEGGASAQRRRITVGRRNIEQIEILSGMKAGERALISDYTGLERIERVDITR